jgi:cytochrome c-type biogenesis protein CcmH/NrfG
MKAHKLGLLGVVLALAVSAAGCNKLKARDQLNKGVAAFRNAQFQTSIEHFKTAAELDPTLLNARLYLATAYAQQYIPGGESEENKKIGMQAIEAFEDVLKMDPNNETAFASIAQIYYNMREFEKAKEYQRRRLQVEPNNPEPYYWIGVINWATAYPRAQQVRKDLNIALPPDPTKPGILPAIPEKARVELEEQNAPIVEEGIEAIQKALDLKPNDTDAMTYLNLLLRQKSEYTKDPAERADLLKQADAWVEKALAIRKGGAPAAPATGGGQ